MINTQHATLPEKIQQSSVSWNQGKAHIYYLHLCTVCVCMCVRACLCVSMWSEKLYNCQGFEWWQWCGRVHWTEVYRSQWRRSYLSEEDAVETEPRRFSSCELWVSGLIYHSSGGMSSSGYVSIKKKRICGLLGCAVLYWRACLMSPGLLCWFLWTGSIEILWILQTGVLLVLKSLCWALCCFLLLAVRTGLWQY